MNGMREKKRGGLLILVLAVLLAVSVLTWSVVQNYATSSVLTKSLDQKRQQLVGESVVRELVREAMYDVAISDGTVLENRIQNYVGKHFKQPVHIEVSGDTPQSMLKPVVWSSEIVHPVSASERAGLPLSIQRWARPGCEIYQGTSLDIRVTAANDYRFRVTPIYIPVSCMPFVAYDLSWDGVYLPSVVSRSVAYRMPMGWEILEGHEWMRQAPSRLRDLLQLRVGLYRQWLDPQHEDDWLRMFAAQATTLNFNEPAVLDRLQSMGGIVVDGSTVRVDLTLFASETLLIQGKGEVVFSGYRGERPLVVVAAPADVGLLRLTVTDSPQGVVGPLVLYGMTSWRSENAGALHVVSSDGTAIAGACILSPGVILDATVRGHISMHTPVRDGYNKEYAMPVEPLSQQEMNQVGRWVPVLTLWDIASEL